MTIIFPDEACAITCKYSYCWSGNSKTNERHLLRHYSHFR